MGYKYKNADTVINDFKTLKSKYKRNTIRLVDYKLPNSYFTTLLPKLVESNININVTCEMKANTTYEKMKLLHEAGFTELQPGIESFITSVLKNMNKGVTAIQNILTIKLGMRLGIVIHYNILYGFTFDTKNDYEDMFTLIRKIVHLQPPATVVEALTTRFSPMQRTPSSQEGPVKKHHKFYLQLSMIFMRG